MSMKSSKAGPKVENETDGPKTKGQKLLLNSEV